MKLKLINGNGYDYTVDTDLLLCFYKPNDFVINRLQKELGLKEYKRLSDLVYFKPKNAMQILKLLTWASTYSFQISYSNNASEKSTMYFKYVDRPQRFFFNNID